MITAYRIFKTRHAKTWFDGEGAFLFGGRWNSRGTRILYAAGSLSLAALEMLVHLNSAELLSSYSFATIDIGEKDIAAVETLQKLPKNWHASPPPFAIQNIGDKWAASMTSPALKVPSAVVRGEHNYLINVSHPDFSKAKLGKPQPFRFDERLIK